MLRRLLVATLAIVALGACADATPSDPGSGSGTGSAIVHPTAADEAILTITTSGGFVPAEYLFTNTPSFALFGDGTLVVPGAQMAIYPGPALPPMIARTIDEEAIQAILRAALDAGLHRDGDYSDLGQMAIADAGTTRFELTVDRTTHVVTAYALGLEGERQPGQPEDVWRMREALRAFEQQLSVLDWLPEGSLGSEGPYAGAAARLLVGPYRPDEALRQPTIDWPLATALGELGDPVDVLGSGYRCGVLAAEAWRAVHALAEDANQLTPWRSDGERYAVVFRPLLPNEAGCEPTA